MKKAVGSILPLLVGIFFIILGNGMHFTLVGLHGDIANFSADALAIITSA